MRRQRVSLPSFLLLLWALVLFAAGSPALAAKDIIIDWEKGEITTETTGPVDEETTGEQAGSRPEGEEDVGGESDRLRRALEIQQQVIRRQRARIEALQKENRRLERLLLGYDRLLRQGR